MRNQRAVSILKREIRIDGIHLVGAFDKGDCIVKVGIGAGNIGGSHDRFIGSHRKRIVEFVAVIYRARYADRQFKNLIPLRRTLGIDCHRNRRLFDREYAVGK